MNNARRALDFVDMMIPSLRRSTLQAYPRVSGYSSTSTKKTCCRVFSSQSVSALTHTDNDDAQSGNRPVETALVVGGGVAGACFFRIVFGSLMVGVSGVNAFYGVAFERRTSLAQASRYSFHSGKEVGSEHASWLHHPSQSVPRLFVSALAAGHLGKELHPFT